jgi:hypothetical protein
MVYAGYKRLLRPDFPLRGADTEDPPAARTHEETCKLGKEADTYDKSGEPDSGHPRHDSGVNRWCPLTILQLFNIIQDVCPDMMHIVKCLLGGHWIPLLKGERDIAAPRFSTKKTDPEYAKKKNLQGQLQGRAMYACSTAHSLRKLHEYC